MECRLALCDLIDGFGRPHVHSGLGIRKLGGKLFECRGNGNLRFIFQDRGTELFVCFLGNHDEPSCAGATIVEHFDTQTILERESVPPCEAHGENNIS